MVDVTPTVRNPEFAKELLTLLENDTPERMKCTISSTSRASATFSQSNEERAIVIGCPEPERECLFKKTILSINHIILFIAILYI